MTHEISHRQENGKSSRVIRHFGSAVVGVVFPCAALSELALTLLIMFGLGINALKAPLILARLALCTGVGEPSRDSPGLEPCSALSASEPESMDQSLLFESLLEPPAECSGVSSSLGVVASISSTGP